MLALFVSIIYQQSRMDESPSNRNILWTQPELNRLQLRLGLTRARIIFSSIEHRQAFNLAQPARVTALIATPFPSFVSRYFRNSLYIYFPLCCFFPLPLYSLPHSPCCFLFLAFSLLQDLYWQTKPTAESSFIPIPSIPPSPFFIYYYFLKIFFSVSFPLFFFLPIFFL